MRYITLSLALLLGFAVQANAGDIQTDSLNAVGLSDMQVMSDAQGMEVRAKGFVWGSSSVSSSSTLFIAGAGPVGGGGVGGFLLSQGSATSTNGYVNRSFFGNPAAGANFSGADAGALAPTAFAGGFSVTNN